jgi:hypothetical protein
MPEQHGPRLVTPSSYMTCDGCKWLDSERSEPKRNGYHFQFQCSKLHLKTIDLADKPTEVVTPSWCPLMPKEEPNA